MPVVAASGSAGSTPEPIRAHSIRRFWASIATALSAAPGVTSVMPNALTASFQRLRAANAIPE